MKRLINILYSCAAGLEQACVTFETIKQAHKAALVMAIRDTPEARQPIGFTQSIPQDAPALFTAEDS